MTFVVVALCITVAILGVLVAGLLRSHAVILRRLNDIGIPAYDDDAMAVMSPNHSDATTAANGSTQGRLQPVTPRPNDAATGRHAPDLSGVTPQGATTVVSVSRRSHDTLLMFLSTDCTSCQPFWDAVSDGRARASETRNRRMVVVTKGPEAELAGTLSERASDVPIVMSSAAWSDYDVPGSPYFVHVDGPSARVRGEGTSGSWEQALDLVGRGVSETATRFSATTTAARRGRPRRAAPPRDSDDEMRAAGIVPGDPSLYVQPDDQHVES